MDRRKLLRLAAVMGPISLTRMAEARAKHSGAKPLIKGWAGEMVDKNENHHYLLRIGVVKKEVVGGLFKRDSGESSGWNLTGTLNRNEFEAEAWRYEFVEGMDPFLLKPYRFTGRLEHGKIVGQYDFTYQALHHTDSFSLSLQEPDTRTMRSLAGTYEGNVQHGPFYQGKAKVKSNGSIRLYDLIDPDGAPMDATVSIYYFIPKVPLAPQTAGSPSAKQGYGGCFNGCCREFLDIPDCSCKPEEVTIPAQPAQITLGTTYIVQHGADYIAVGRTGR